MSSGISGGGVAGSLSSNEDGDEPASSKWFQFPFTCQELVITVACVSGAEGLQDPGGVGWAMNRDITKTRSLPWNSPGPAL